MVGLAEAVAAAAGATTGGGGVAVAGALPDGVLGAIGRTPGDIGLMLSVLAGYDPRCPNAVRQDPSAFARPDADPDASGQPLAGAGEDYPTIGRSGLLLDSDWEGTFRKGLGLRLEGLTVQRPS